MGPKALSYTMFLLNLVHLSLACYYYVSTTLQKKHPCLKKSCIIIFLSTLRYFSYSLLLSISSFGREFCTTFFLNDILIHTDLWWNPCIVCILYFMHAFNSMFCKSRFYFKWGLYLHVGLCVVQYLFDSMKDITIMPCGHTMHLECIHEMDKHAKWVVFLTWKERFEWHFSL